MDNLLILAKDGGEERQQNRLGVMKGWKVDRQIDRAFVWSEY